jgi:cytochrome c2
MPWQHTSRSLRHAGLAVGVGALAGAIAGWSWRHAAPAEQPRVAAAVPERAMPGDASRHGIVHAVFLGLVLLAACVAGCWWWDLSREAAERAATLTGGDPAHGRTLLRGFGCTGCHSIPGVAGADGRAGPALDGVAGRVWIGGAVLNKPDALVRWIENPRDLVPGTAMPPTGATGQDARDIAAFLYTLR